MTCYWKMDWGAVNRISELYGNQVAHSEIRRYSLIEKSRVSPATEQVEAPFNLEALDKLMKAHTYLLSTIPYTTTNGVHVFQIID